MKKSLERGILTYIIIVILPSIHEIFKSVWHIASEMKYAYLLPSADKVDS